MLVLIVVEVVERGEISPAVAQQGGWGVGAGHWARVSWGIRMRIRIRDTSRNKDIFRSVVNKPIPLGRPPLQVFLLHFSLYIFFYFYFHPTPHPAPSICKMSAQARGKAKEKPIASLLAGATAGVSRHSSLSPSKVSRPNFNSVLSTAARWAPLFLFPHPLTGYSNGLASHPVPSPQIDDPAKRCTRFVRWLYSGGDWQCRQGRCAVYYL